MTAPAPAERPASRSILLIVFTTILIDFIGFSVLIPVLPLYAEKLGASPLQVGLILTVYALAQVVFLPIWGWVSDRVGRRPVILVSLFGTVISFAVLSFADTIELVYLARALAGFFAASIGTAQAVVCLKYNESRKKVLLLGNRREQNCIVKTIAPYVFLQQ